MSDLRPNTSGTVTFLFSDIEGSSRIEQEVGTERYAELLARHREILRAAFEAHAGAEQSTEGDSFFVIFQSASEAVRAAVESQRGLAEADWPGDAPGPGPDRPSYGRGHPDRRGLRRHRHQPGGPDRSRRPWRPGRGLGGDPRDRRRQPCRRASPGATSGSFRLRDFAEPERLSQLDVDGLPTDFPVLRTIDARPNNLPSTVTSFVGRERELDDARTPAADGPAADGDRTRRDRQDAVRDRAGPRCRDRLPRRHVLRPVRAGRRSDARPRHDRPGGRHRRERRSSRPSSC